MAYQAKLTEQVSLLMEPEMRALIDTEAAERGVSIGQVVRDALTRRYERSTAAGQPYHYSGDVLVDTGGIYDLAKLQPAWEQRTGADQSEHSVPVDTDD